MPGLNTKPTVLVTDRDAATRAWLRRLLKSVDVPVREFATAEELLGISTWPAVGCLILDAQTPLLGGTAFLAELERHGLLLPTILTSTRAEIPDVVSAIKGGAFDYLLKPLDEPTVLDRVQRALAQSHGKQQRDSRRASIQLRIASLTPRERSVARLLSAGHSTKSIASQLKISPKTVDIHRTRILHKAQVDSVVQFVNLVNEMGCFGGE